MTGVEEVDAEDGEEGIRIQQNDRQSTSRISPTLASLTLHLLDFLFLAWHFKISWVPVSNWIPKGKSGPECLCTLKKFCICFLYPSS